MGRRGLKRLAYGEEKVKVIYCSPLDSERLDRDGEVVIYLDLRQYLKISKVSENTAKILESNSEKFKNGEEIEIKPVL